MSSSESAASSLPPGDVVLDAEAVTAEGRRLVCWALDEDVGVDGDVTSAAVVPADVVGHGELVARVDGVVAGSWLVAEVFDQVDPRVSVELSVADGDRVAAGQSLGRVAGPLRSVLTGERTALNLLTHLSGIATLTRRYVDAVAGTGCAVRDTRKTVPGTRLLAKSAVRAGGGVNHRVGLSDALLVKDNHAAVAGGVGPATVQALSRAAGRHVQVEVDSLEELEEAVAAGARDLLLDNLGPEVTREAVERARRLEREHGSVALEASGRIDLTTVRAYAQAGVDRVAIGAITHSAPQLDIGLDIRAAPARGPQRGR